MKSHPRKSIPVESQSINISVWCVNFLLSVTQSWRFFRENSYWLVIFVSLTTNFLDCFFRQNMKLPSQQPTVLTATDFPTKWLNAGATAATQPTRAVLSCTWSCCSVKKKVKWLSFTKWTGKSSHLYTRSQINRPTCLWVSFSVCLMAKKKIKLIQNFQGILLKISLLSDYPPYMSNFC